MKNITMKKLYDEALSDFRHNQLGWFFLIAIDLVLISLRLSFVFFELHMSQFSVVASHYDVLIAIVTTGIVFFKVTLQKNALDGAYGRPLSFVTISRSVIIASLASLLLYVYQYLLVLKNMVAAMSLHPLIILFLTSVIYTVGIYFFIRTFFVDLFILEKNYSFVQALQKSFAVTAGYEFCIVKMIVVLSVVSILSVISIVGAFFVLPIACLMKANLFKHIVR